MHSFFLKLISAALWVWFVISSLILTPPLFVIWGLTFFFDRRLRILHLYSCFWGAQYIWVNPLWRLKIIDREKFKSFRAQVVVSNHQSLVDIIVIYSLFKHFRWTSKLENFRLPFVGWVLRLNNSIKIFRNDPDAYGKFRKQALKALSDGNSIMIFPEGTRSKNTRLRKFKEGAFRVALETGSDILPVVLNGTGKAIPKKGWSLEGKQKLVCKVLDPLPYDVFKNKTAAETAEMTHQIIQKALDDLKS